MLYSIFKILIIIALLEFLYKLFLLNKKDKSLSLKHTVLLIIKALFIIFSVSYVCQEIYILKYGKFHYCLNLDYILNDIKDNTTKYVFTFIVTLSLSAFIEILYRMYKFLLGEISNKFVYKFDDMSTNFAKKLILKKLSHDGIVNIKNGKIIMDKRGNMLKGTFKDISYNYLVPFQAITATALSILFIYINFIPNRFQVIFIVLVFLFIAIHISFSVFVNSFIRSLRHIDNLL